MGTPLWFPERRTSRRKGCWRRAIRAQPRYFRVRPISVAGFHPRSYRPTAHDVSAKALAPILLKFFVKAPRFVMLRKDLATSEQSIDRFLGSEVLRHVH